jgi:hypothetical protein
MDDGVAKIITFIIVRDFCVAIRMHLKTFDDRKINIK